MAAAGDTRREFNAMNIRHLKEKRKARYHPADQKQKSLIWVIIYLTHSRSPRRRRERKIARGKREARGPWDASGASIRALEVRGDSLRPFRALRILGNLIQAQRDLPSLAPGYLLLAPPARTTRMYQVHNHRNGRRRGASMILAETEEALD